MEDSKVLEIAQSLIASGSKLTVKDLKDAKIYNDINRRFGGSMKFRELLGVYGDYETRFMSKELLDVKLSELALKYGDTLTLEICAKEGCSKRVIHKYYEDFNEVLRTLSLQERPSNNSTAQDNKNLTREDVILKVESLIKIYGNNLTRQILSENKIGEKLIKKYFSSFQELKKYFNIIGGSQDAFLSIFEHLTGFDVQREVSFDSLINPITGKHLRFDGYIKELNLLLEFDDASHFEDLYQDETLEERKFRDDFKTTWASSHNFNLMRFRYNEPFSYAYISEKLKSLNIVLSKDYGIYEPRYTYRGISFDNSRKGFIVKLKFNGKMTYLGTYVDELYAAIIREKFIIEHNLPNIKNEISLDDLKSKGFNSWEEVPLYDLNRQYASNYYGVRFYRDKFVSEQVTNGKAIYIARSESEDEVAIAREKWLDTHPEVKAKRNKIKGYNC